MEVHRAFRICGVSRGGGPPRGGVPSRRGQSDCVARERQLAATSPNRAAARGARARAPLAARGRATSPWPGTPCVALLDRLLRRNASCATWNRDFFRAHVKKRAKVRKIEVKSLPCMHLPRAQKCAQLRTFARQCAGLEVTNPEAYASGSPSSASGSPRIRLAVHPARHVDRSPLRTLAVGSRLNGTSGNPQSPIRSPQSTIHNPKSAIHNRLRPYPNCHSAIFSVSPKRRFTPSTAAGSKPQCTMQFSQRGSLPRPNLSQSVNCTSSRWVL
jgi:hypothetical protein